MNPAPPTSKIPACNAFSSCLTLTPFFSARLRNRSISEGASAVEIRPRSCSNSFSLSIFTTACSKTTTVHLPKFPEQKTGIELNDSRSEYSAHIFRECAALSACDFYISDVGSCAGISKTAANPYPRDESLSLEAMRSPGSKYNTTKIHYCGMERETGIEPATNSLEGCDSTTELLPPDFNLWSR